VQNVHRWKPSTDLDRCVSVREIGHERIELGVWMPPANGRDAFRHARFGATANDNACAFGSERSNNGETNSGGGAVTKAVLFSNFNFMDASGCVFRSVLTR